MLRSTRPSRVEREDLRRCWRRPSRLDEVGRSLIVEDELEFEAGLSEHPAGPIRRLVERVERRRWTEVVGEAGPAEEGQQRRLPDDDSRLVQLDLRLVRWSEQHPERLDARLGHLLDLDLLQ